MEHLQPRQKTNKFEETCKRSINNTFSYFLIIAILQKSTRKIPKIQLIKYRGLFFTLNKTKNRDVHSVWLTENQTKPK